MSTSERICELTGCREFSLEPRLPKSEARRAWRSAKSVSDRRKAAGVRSWVIAGLFQQGVSG
jgi:hypothetical protein